MESRKSRIRLLFIIWTLFIIIVTGVVTVLVKDLIGKKKETALHKPWNEALTEKIYFDADETIADAVFDNYMKYLNMAYIVLGEYPDFLLVKISANVERNDINWAEDFYCPEGGLYWKRFKDGQPTGKVAIDVSEYQYDIDWEKVKAAGVEVAVVRAGFRGYSNGKLVKDENFDANMQGAQAVGIETAVYFFSEAINREEGEEEARFVLEMLKGYNITQPIIIDTEYIFEAEDARANDISEDDRTAAVVGFCETIKEAGYTPMVYASRDQFIFYMNIDDIGDYEFWLAAYDTTKFPYHTEAYQYTPNGLVDGIEGNVDLDVWMR